MCLEITKQAVINEQSDEIFIRNRQKTINKVSTLYIFGRLISEGLEIEKNDLTGP